MLFGRRDPELDFEQLNLSKAATKLQSEAPLFTYLIIESAQNQRESDKWRYIQTMAYGPMYVELPLAWHMISGSYRPILIQGEVRRQLPI